MAAETNFDGFKYMEWLIRNKPNPNQEELIKAYSIWSQTYDKDVQNQEYVAPAVAAEMLAQKLNEIGYNKDVKILDLGCGTGLVGEQLHKHGYKNIDGIDLTPSLLEVAKTKGVYSSLQQGSMGSEQCLDLGVDSKKYDAAICVGVFNFGHVKSKGLDDLVHVVKPGGLVSFSIRDMAFNNPQTGFNEKIDKFCEEGVWKLIAKHYEPRYVKESDGGWFFVYQIL